MVEKDICLHEQVITQFSYRSSVLTVSMYFLPSVIET